MENNIKEILNYIGEDASREGLIETPKRIIKSWKELYKGYHEDPKKLAKTFSSDGYQGIVLLKDIEMYSMCEHHMLPFYGKCHIAYIPDKKIIGISKLARIMEVFARRLQVQERLTEQIATCLEEILQPKGVAVMIEAEHFCIRTRGIGKQDPYLLTASYKGCFLDEPMKRDDFLTMVKK